MRGHADVEQTLAQLGHGYDGGTREYRIFGPPGTGKTTSLSGQVHRALERFGQDSVLVTCFSRAAAEELAGRDLALSADHIGTLHSHCWHALGRPEIAEVHVADWNRRNPHLHITPVNRGRKLDGEEPGEEGELSARRGDLLLSSLNRIRGMLIPSDNWPAPVREFAAKWDAYKKSCRLFDFCDLIDIASHDIKTAPFKPAVLVTDEAQDLNPMQMKVIRKWGERTEYFILAADDDQTIYSWCGATTPDTLLEPEIPADHKIFLEQSHRIPSIIHERSTALTGQVSRRQAKVYKPRLGDGALVRLVHGDYKSPEHSILRSVIRHVEKGESVMLLASCAYMLYPTIAVLKKWGIPFHNPYRKSNGHWNTLRLKSKGSTASRVLALLRAHPDFGDGAYVWTYGDLKQWTEWLRPGVLRPDALTRLQQEPNRSLVPLDCLPDIFEPASLESLIPLLGADCRQLLVWWQQRIAASHHSRTEFPINVVRQFGPNALQRTPQVLVGTIHSVKDGEADVVFLFPDLSRTGHNQYQRYGPQRDAVIRLFYVGMTRARHTLYVCQRKSSLAALI